MTGVRRRYALLLLAMLLVSVLWIIFANGEKALAQSCDPGYAEGEILIGVRADAAEGELDRVRGLNGESPETLLYAGGLIWVVELPVGLSVPEAVDLYSADPAVEYAEPNGIYYIDEACLEPVVQADAIVSTTGVLSKPEATTYMYGSHALVGPDSRTRYALYEDTAALDALVGKKVSVTGVVVPGTENRQIDGGPPLLKVTAIEAAPDYAGLPPEMIASNARVLVEEGVAEWRNSGFTDDSLDEIASEMVSLSVSYGTVSKTVSGEKVAWTWSAPVTRGSADTRPSSVTVTATDPSGLSNRVTFEIGVRAVAPSVEITAPVQGAFVGGVTILSALASDTSGVTGPVEFYVDGEGVGQDQEPPYKVEWDSTIHPDGTVEVTALARDGYGFSGLSAPRTVVVDNTAPATPVIVAPVQGSLLNRSAFVISGTGEPGSTVELFEGSTFRGKTVAAGSGNWSLPLTGVTDSRHYYRAKSTDASGKSSAASGDRVVTVDSRRPGVVVTSPVHRATSVAPGTNVSATFSERMNQSTLNSRTVVLSRLDTSSQVAATIRYDAARNRVVLDPKRNLRPGTSYAVYLYTGAKDLAGNRLASTKTWKFTVRR